MFRRRARRARSALGARGRRSARRWLVRCAAWPLALAGLSAPASAQSARIDCDALLLAAREPAVGAFLSRTGAAHGTGQLGNRIDGLRVVRVEGASVERLTGQVLSLGDYFLCSDSAAPDDAPAPAVATAREVYRFPNWTFDFSVGLRWPESVADALDAHAHSVRLRDWFRELGLERGYDGADGAFVVAVGAPEDEHNASYASVRLPGVERTLGAVIFTPPEGCHDAPARCSAEHDAPAYSAALDVVAHEWAHGITDFHSGLTYAREAGALNEAFSDWIAVAADFALGDGDWIIGEDVGALRNVRFPWAFFDPGTYRDASWLPADALSCPQPSQDNDYCGVHTNNGVGNRMFYLLSKGGDQSGVEVAGVGVVTATLVALAAQQGGYWSAQSDYPDAAAGMRAAAAAFGAEVAEQVRKAWEAVCVLSRTERCPDASLVRPEAVFVSVSVPDRSVIAELYPSASTRRGCVLATATAALDLAELRAHAGCRMQPFFGGPQRLDAALGESTPTVSVHLLLESAEGATWMLAFGSMTLAAAAAFDPEISVGARSVTLRFDADAPGELAALVSSAPGPAAASELDAFGARRQVVSAGRNTFVWDGLRPHARYDVYAVLRSFVSLEPRVVRVDASSTREREVWSALFTPQAVLDSPLFTHRGLETGAGAVSPALSSAPATVRATTVRWELEANVPGEIHYLALPANAAAGVQLDDVLGHPLSRVANASPGVNTVEWRFLDPSSNYALYAVLRADPIAHSALARASARTGAAPNSLPSAPADALLGRGGSGGGFGPWLALVAALGARRTGAARRRRRTRCAGWLGLACALASAPAGARDCDSSGVLLTRFDDPQLGSLAPTTGGEGLGLFGVSREGLNTVRLVGSGAIRQHTSGLSAQPLSQGDHFLCTNAFAAPAASSATVLALRGLNGSRTVLELDPSADNRWGAGTEDAVDAFHYSVAMRDWLSARFGLNAFDDRRGVFLTAVGVSEFKPGELNAFYTLHALGALASFTLAVDGIEGTYASAPDVVGHEWGHALAQSFSGLSARRAPGAVAEAFCDWVGAAFERLDPDAPAAGRWLIGERVHSIRDMQNPLRHGDPDTHLGFGWRGVDAASCPTPNDDNDNCYVHSNNGVGNKMFQLLADGGVHNGVRVVGLGAERAIEIAMDAHRHRWSASTDFLDARAGMVDSAAEFGAHEKTQTERAWRAVCVGDARPAPPACPAPNALQARRVRVTTTEPVSGSSTAVLSMAIPALPGVDSSTAVGTAHFLVSADAGLSAADVAAATDTVSAPLRTVAYKATFRDLEPQVDYVFYALLHRDGHDPGPLRSAPVRVGDTAPALRAGSPTVDGGSATIAVVSGMDGTLLHLALPAAAVADAGLGARELLERPDARVQVAVAGVTGTLSWDGLATGSDHIWHAVAVQTLDEDDAGGGDIAGNYASALLRVPFRTGGPPAIALSLSASAGPRRLDIGVAASAAGTLTYLVLAAAAAGPADAAALVARANAREAQVPAGAGALSWDGLEPGADYAAYAFVRSAAGESGLAVARSSTLPAPMLSVSASAGPRRLDIDVAASAAGTLSYLVLTAAAAGPADAAALAARADARQAEIQAGANALSWDGIEPGADYAAYAFVRSAAGESGLAVARSSTLPAPTLSVSASAGPRRVDIGVVASAAGTLSYLVLAAAAAGPVDAAALVARADAREAQVPAGAGALSWGGLEPGADYAAYAFVRSAAGESGVAVARSSTLPAPTLSVSASAGPRRVDIGVVASAAGTLTYLVLAAAAAGPTDAAALVARADAREAQVPAGANALSWDGLEPGADYAAYAFVRSAAGESGLAVARSSTLPADAVAAGGGGCALGGGDNGLGLLLACCWLRLFWRRRSGAPTRAPA